MNAMKCCTNVRRAFPGMILILVAALLETASAQDRVIKHRKYTGRIQMHETPVSVRVPEEEPEDSGTLADNLDIDDSPTIGIDSRENLLPYLQQTAPRPDKEKKKKKNKNWILPPSQVDEEMESEDEDEEDLLKPSWGWLADDVRDQDPTSLDEEENAKESPEREQQNIRARAEQPAGAGLLMDTKYSPVQPSTKYLSDTPKPDVMKMATIEEEMAVREAMKQKDTLAGMEPDPSRREQASSKGYSSDRSWGGDHIWDQSKRKDSVLPRSSTVLSGPSPAGMKKPAFGTALPSPMRSKASSAAMQTPSRSSSISSPTAFQPTHSRSSWGVDASPSRSFFNAFDKPATPAASVSASSPGGNYFKPLQSQQPSAIRSLGAPLDR